MQDCDLFNDLEEKNDGDDQESQEPPVGICRRNVETFISLQTFTVAW